MDSGDQMVLFGVFTFLFVVVGIIVLLFFASKPYSRLATQLRPHAWTALIWTAITFFQTASVLICSMTPNPLGYVVAAIAGWTMISSWRQLLERRQGNLVMQRQRSLPHRLFVQTIWGPLAIWLVAITIPFAADRLVWQAISHRDIVRIHLLKACGFSATNDFRRLEMGLQTVVERQDSQGVLTYLEAGAATSDWDWVSRPPLVIAVKRNDAVITELLLRYGADPTFGDSVTGGPLQTAVSFDNVRQVRVLLSHGIDFSNGDFPSGSRGRDLLLLAKKHKNPAMIALLRSAGAK